MTEDSNIQDDDYLVRVKAQVMTRDDSTGGWVPMGGGGMSIVGLRKLVISSGEDIRHEYLIHGERIADQSVVLNCVLKKDVQYTKANPTFHHWKTEEKRFGLTFQSSADARAFDKGVKRAVEDLLEVLRNSMGKSSPESNDLEVGDDEVFMTLELPLVGRKDSSSQSASTASTTTSSPSPQSPALSSPTMPPESYNPNSPPHVFNHPPANHHHLYRVHYITKSQQPTSPNNSQKSNSTKSKSSNESGGLHGPDEIWLKSDSVNGSLDKIKSEDSTTTDDNIEITLRDNVDNSYVQFENRPSHEYSYPRIESIRPSAQQPLPPQPGSRRDSISSLKKHNLDVIQPPLPTKSKHKRKDWLRRDKRQTCHLLSQRSRCVYCHEMFVHADNGRGACEDSPDKVAVCIERASCICCARGMLYHCMADSDGDYGHPCVCDSTDDTNCRKWTALTILSMFVPCLWCYWPMRACHRCGTTCGCCGGRHKAA